MAYTVKVVDVDGGVFGTLSDQARIVGLADELNGPGSVTISLPTTHPDTVYLQPGREVQILDGTDVVWWGPIVRPQAGLVESTWQCQGLLWYFQHRFFGTADRTNLISNGGFEDGEDDWSFEDGVSHSVETDPDFVFDGDQSLELNGSAADHTEHAQQVYTHAAQYHPLGDAVTVSVWVFIPSAGYLGGALDDRGLMVVRKALDGTVLDVQTAEVGDDTTKDVWVNLEVLIPGVHEDDTLEVRLYPPHGTGFFDDVTVTLMESLPFEHDDVATIVEGVVAYAQGQDPAFDHGKTDLNITVAGGPLGKTASRVYMFSEHRQIADAVLEFVAQGVMDIDFVLTSTTRTLTVQAVLGSLHGTTLELDTNLAGFTWSWDGDRAASSVVVLGPGDGPDRPEGGKSDPAGFGGSGTTLELVETAPEDVTVKELDAWAEETLKMAKSPQILEVTTLPGAGIIGNLHVGDTVPVLIQHGWVDIDGLFRVVKIEVDPYQDTAKITLNPVP